jgi:hypothetical protein
MDKEKLDEINILVNTGQIDLKDFFSLHIRGLSHPTFLCRPPLLEKFTNQFGEPKKIITDTVYQKTWHVTSREGIQFEITLL